MRASSVQIGCLVGPLLAVCVGANPLLEGRVLLPSGDPVAGAQVRLFDLTDLRAAPVEGIADESGYFALPLRALPGPSLPERFELGANYPNPFNPSTLMPYQLPAPMHVRLEVFNILGQRIATLVDGERPAGFHTAVWDGTDQSGQAVGAGVYLYRLSGVSVISRSMLLIDGQAGVPSAGSSSRMPSGPEGAEAAPLHGLTVTGPGLVPYVDPDLQVETGMASVSLVVETLAGAPLAKVASGGILGDVNNTQRVDFSDALLIVLYSLDASTVMPNNGDISLGDVNDDGQVDRTDAWTIVAYLNDPSDPSLPSGIGAAAEGEAASLSPNPSTAALDDDGAWHRFTVEATEPVSVVVNPAGTDRRLEITTRSGRGNYCPAESNDDVSREDGQVVYLAGCASGDATVELRRESDGTVLRTYTFEVTGSPADLVVESVSVSAGTLTPGQSFTLQATVRNQGTAAAASAILRYRRSPNAIISTRDTVVATDEVDALDASGTSAESIQLTAPSAGTYYYGACVDRAVGESGGNNCSTAVRVRVEAPAPGLLVQSISASTSTLNSGGSFTLSATVHNQGSAESDVTTLSYYRRSTQDSLRSLVGSAQVDALDPGGTVVKSIRLKPPVGTYDYNACLTPATVESDIDNCSASTRVVVMSDSLTSFPDSLALPDSLGINNPTGFRLPGRLHRGVGTLRLEQADTPAPASQEHRACARLDQLVTIWSQTRHPRYARLRLAMTRVV